MRIVSPILLAVLVSSGCNTRVMEQVWQMALTPEGGAHAVAFDAGTTLDGYKQYRYLYTLDPAGRIDDVRAAPANEFREISEGVRASEKDGAQLVLDGSATLTARSQDGVVTVTREGTAPWQLAPVGLSTVQRLSFISSGAFLLAAVDDASQVSISKITVDGALAWTTALPSQQSFGLFK
jgi:hypothetical protein